MKPPLIESVEAIGASSLRIRWNTGETLPVDLAEPIARLSALAALRDPAFFAQAAIGEWGHSVQWSEEVELGADRLYERSRMQAGEPTPKEFDAWIRSNGLSLTTAAKALGLSRRMIAHYRTGSRPIPRVVWLACKGWEAMRSRAA